MAPTICLLLLELEGAEGSKILDVRPQKWGAPSPSHLLPQTWGAVKFEGFCLAVGLAGQWYCLFWWHLSSLFSPSCAPAAGSGTSLFLFSAKKDGDVQSAGRFCAVKTSFGSNMTQATSPKRGCFTPKSSPSSQHIPRAAPHAHSRVKSAPS